MKKYFFAALCCLGLALSANAQETFRKGSHDLRLGVGVSGRKYVSLPALSADEEEFRRRREINKEAISSGGRGCQTRYSLLERGDYSLL